MKFNIVLLVMFVLVFACKTDKARKPLKQVSATNIKNDMQKNIDAYATVKLKTDLSKLT